MLCFCKTSVGTEELAHQEMIASLVYKLTCGAGPKEFEKAGWSAKWAQNGPGMFWMDANGVPWIANNVSCVGEPIADLTSNMAAEQRARVTYEHLISQTCDPLVKDMLRFLWQREVVHLQRFGEANRTNLSRFSPKRNRQDFYFLTVSICSRLS